MKPFLSILCLLIAIIPASAALSEKRFVYASCSVPDGSNQRVEWPAYYQQHDRDVWTHKLPSPHRLWSTAGILGGIGLLSFVAGAFVMASNLSVGSFLLVIGAILLGLGLLYALWGLFKYLKYKKHQRRIGSDSE